MKPPTESHGATIALAWPEIAERYAKLERGAPSTAQQMKPLLLRSLADLVDSVIHEHIQALPPNIQLTENVIQPSQATPTRSDPYQIDLLTTMSPSETLAGRPTLEQMSAKLGQRAVRIFFLI